jgi:hypothetical protein
MHIYTETYKALNYVSQDNTVRHRYDVINVKIKIMIMCQELLLLNIKLLPVHIISLAYTQTNPLRETVYSGNCNELKIKVCTDVADIYSEETNPLHSYLLRNYSLIDKIFNLLENCNPLLEDQ